MSNSIIIIVKKGLCEILYEQTVTESLSCSATTEDGYSKSNSNTVLLKTIKSLCSEVANLHGK